MGKIFRLSTEGSCSSWTEKEENVLEQQVPLAYCTARLDINPRLSEIKCSLISRYCALEIGESKREDDDDDDDQEASSSLRDKTCW